MSNPKLMLHGRGWGDSQGDPINPATLLQRFNGAHAGLDRRGILRG